MNPAQLLLLGKISVVGVFVIGLYLTGHHMGAKAVQTDWDHDRATRIAAQDKLIDDNDKQIMQLQTKFNETNVQISIDHENALQAITKKYDADIAAVRATGGLRIPRTVCSAPATTTQAASDSGHYEAAADSIQLPDSIAANLFSEAKRADEIVEQTRACQSWIRQNGFYTIHQASP
jgi:hypothetical protein